MNWGSLAEAPVRPKSVLLAIPLLGRDPFGRYQRHGHTAAPFIRRQPNDTPLAQPRATARRPGAPRAHPHPSENLKAEHTSRILPSPSSATLGPSTDCRTVIAL
jgi:hypothetical protein